MSSKEKSDKKNVDADKSNEIPRNVYAYIHVLPSKTGEGYRREIVPINVISNFDFTEYNNNIEFYKKKKYKVQFSPEGKKHKCLILYVHDCYTKVYEASVNNRFSIPTHTDTLPDPSENIGDNSEILTQNVTQKVPSNDVKITKKNRKNIAAQKKQNKENTEKEIIENYVNNADELSETDVNEDDCQTNVSNGADYNEITNCATSTPVRQQHFERDKDAMIRAQSIQIQELQQQMTEARREVRRMRREYAQENNDQPLVQQAVDNVNDNRTDPGTNRPRIYDNPFRVHDKIFGFYSEEDEEQIQFDDKGNIHIGYGVYCNPTAYYDSFKGKSPQKCLYLLSQGVYGVKDLSERCVRKQRNTLHKKTLSPTKCIAIERKVYAFMRMKSKTISQVDDFLDNINKIHHQAIYAAKARFNTEQKLLAEENTIDRNLNNLAAQQEN